MQSGDKGVSTSYTSSVTLVNNLIYASAEGIAVQDGSQAHLVNNTLTGNGRGVGLHRHYLDRVFPVLFLSLAADLAIAIVVMV
jgi:parallel beta-helix repeat protein